MNSPLRAPLEAKKKSRLEIYVIGAHLVNFLIERELISLYDLHNVDNYIVKKKGKYFIPLSLYVICNFDLSILPIHLNLPMVCKPLNWRSILPKDKIPQTLSDLSGGYLSEPTGDIYHRYRVITSQDSSQFNIMLGDNYESLIGIMNILQSEPYTINSSLLTFIENNRDLLEELGLLMPRFLASLNQKEALDILRQSFDEDKSIKKITSYPSLVQILLKRIQRAHDEFIILTLCSSYDGYKFYLPAFIDFRGRIYRSGILHFHQRDLAKSLIVFANQVQPHNYNELLKDCSIEDKMNIDKLTEIVSTAASHN